MRLQTMMSSASRRLTLLTALSCHLVVAIPRLAAMADDSPAAEPFIAARRAREEVEEKIRLAVVKARVTFDFTDTPLSEAVQTVCRKAGLQNARLDQAALNEEGIATDEPITRALTEATLENALKICLEPLGLTWVVSNEMLVVTTQVKADEILTRKFHDIRDLRPVFAAAAEKTPDRAKRPATFLLGTSDEYPSGVRRLVSLLMQETSGPWQDVDGTGGRIVPLGPSLLVQQTERVQREVEQTLRIVRQFLKAPAEGSMFPFHGSEQQADDWRKHWTALGKVVGPLDFKETPLNEVFAKLSEANGVTFILDETALMEEGVDVKEPVTFSTGRMTLNSALTTMLEDFGLTIILEDGVVKVTTVVKADEKLTTLLFDLRDLTAAGVSEADLADLLEQETSGPWQEIDGSGGTISIPLPGAFVIRQTQKVQWEISEFLEKFRKVVAEGGDWKKWIAAGEHDKSPVVRFYSLDRKGLAEPMRTALIELVEPKSWENAGGEGTIRRIEETLVVRQTPAVHKKILEFLKSFKESEDAPVLTTPATPAFRGF